jgi:hypothetical protein
MSDKKILDIKKTLTPMSNRLSQSSKLLKKDISISRMSIQKIETNGLRSDRELGNSTQ